MRNARLSAALANSAAAAVQDESWDWYGIPLPLRISSHIGATDLPDELVTSVRCVLAVDDSIIVCETPNDIHIWPGGRREGDESYQQTAVRELREEVGWTITPDSLVPLGFLHFEHLAVPPTDYPFPHPDFVQLIFGTWSHDSSGAPLADWTDVEGWNNGATPSASLIWAACRCRDSSVPSSALLTAIERPNANTQA